MPEGNSISKCLACKLNCLYTLLKLERSSLTENVLLNLMYSQLYLVLITKTPFHKITSHVILLSTTTILQDVSKPVFFVHFLFLSSEYRVLFIIAG